MSGKDFFWLMVSVSAGQLLGALVLGPAMIAFAKAHGWWPA